MEKVIAFLKSDTVKRGLVRALRVFVLTVVSVVIAGLVKEPTLPVFLIPVLAGLEKVVREELTK